MATMPVKVMVGVMGGGSASDAHLAMAYRLKRPITTARHASRRHAAEAIAQGRHGCPRKPRTGRTAPHWPHRQMAAA